MIGSCARVEAAPDSDLDWNIIAADDGVEKLNLETVCADLELRDLDVQKALAFDKVTDHAATVAQGTPRCRSFTVSELTESFPPETAAALNATILCASYPTVVPSSRPALRELRERILASGDAPDSRFSLAKARMCLLVKKLYSEKSAQYQQVKAAHTVMSCLAQIIDLVVSRYARLVSDTKPNAADHIWPYWALAWCTESIPISPDNRERLANLGAQTSAARLNGQNLERGFSESVGSLVRDILVELNEQRNPSTGSSYLDPRQLEWLLELLGSSPHTPGLCAGIC
jgi:hypothetical protein